MKTRWSGPNPLGTVFSIQLIDGAPWLDDGTVVTSDYNPSDWTFSTAYSPEDRWHPVSGNRKFGVQRDAHTGLVTIYTRGVDRLSIDTYDWAQTVTGAPFENADALWRSFVQSISSEVDGATTSAVTHRPDYE